MQNLLNDLKDTLKKDERVFVDGKILKNKLTELALKFDDQLIEFLLSNKDIKGKFFIDKKIKQDHIFLFNKDEFVKFINNKEFLPDSFTTFKNFIGLQQNDEYLKDTGDVVLVWPYKDCVLEGGQEQEDDKRDEIFYNETLAPDEISRLFDKKVLSNFRKFDGKNIKEGHKTFEISDSDNFIIKGNNLLVLQSIKEKFRNKVKLIYIDPPYNTGGDSFKYNDKFNHSTWLTFIKNRLDVAKDLMSQDGLIFIQIDDREEAYLKVLCDDPQLFGRDNFIATITVKSKTPSGVGQESFIFDVTERILVYAKDINSIEKKGLKIFDEMVDENSRTADNYNLIIDSYGTESSSFELKTGKGKPIKVVALKNFKYNRQPRKNISGSWYYNNFEKIFRLSPANGGLMKKITPKLPAGACFIEYVPEKGKYANQKMRIYFIDKEMVVMLSESSVKNEKGEVEKMVNMHNNWTDESLWQGIASEGGVVLKNGKKPERLLKRIIELSTKNNDLVLDFFAGSGTTCAVAHKMKRRYIGIEQMDYIHDLPEARLKNVIQGDKTGISKDKNVNWTQGGSFVYAEIKEWNEKYISDIQKADSSQKLLNIYDIMKNEAFFRYDVDHKKFDRNEFKKLSIKEQKDILINCLDKNHLYVNYSEINDKIYKISEDDKLTNKKFYGK